MDIIIGSGNNRKKFEISTGKAMRDLAKTNGIEHAKIVGNLKALVRRQPKVSMSKAAFEKLKDKNEARK